MNVMTILGSYRRNGNTAHILELVEVALTAHGAVIDRLNLGEAWLHACRGCRICFDDGEAHCPCRDDQQNIYARMQAADLLIVATPVYVNDVSGHIKTWLDRFAFVCHRPAFAGKYVYLLATVGVGPTGHALRTLTVAMRTWGYAIVGQRGFKMGAWMKRDAVLATFQPAAQRIAGQCMQALARGQAANPSFFNLMTFRIQQVAWIREPDESLDYIYWQQQGWLEQQCTFYIDHRAGRIKVALARLAGSVLAPFVS